MTDQREAELLQRIAAREEALAAARQEIKLLRSKLDALARRLFGRSSEQLNPAQMQLLLQELDAPGPALGKGSSPEAIETEPSRPKKVSRKSRGPRVPEHLPVIEETIVPEVVKTAPEAWRRIGEEVSEQLDYEPAR